MEIAFLGLGIMGAPMARRLAMAGHGVRGWNRTRARAERLAADGVRIADTPRDAADGAEVMILMPSTEAVCDALLFDDGGALPGRLAPGGCVVVMSSISPEGARAQAARLADAGIDYVDAPVSGGEAGAIGGTLAIMAGGDARRIEALRPLFAPLGRVTPVGPAGSGQLVKLANQLIVGVSIGAVAEALALVEAGGGDSAAAIEAMAGGFADSMVLRMHGRRMVARQFAPGARASIQLKDMDMIMASAASLGQAPPLAALTRTLYADACAAGLADLDHSALFLALGGKEG